MTENESGSNEMKCVHGVRRHPSLFEKMFPSSRSRQRAEDNLGSESRIAGTLRLLPAHQSRCSFIRTLRLLTRGTAKKKVRRFFELMSMKDQRNGQSGEFKFNPDPHLDSRRKSAATESRFTSLRIVLRITPMAHSDLPY